MSSISSIVFSSILEYFMNLQRLYMKYFNFYQNFLIMSFIILSIIALLIVVLGDKRTSVIALVLYTIFAIVFGTTLLVLLYPPFMKLVYPYFNSLFTFFSDLYRNLSTYFHGLRLSW